MYITHINCMSGVIYSGDTEAKDSVAEKGKAMLHRL